MLALLSFLQTTPPAVDLSGYFATLAVLAGAALAVVQFIKGLVKSTNSVVNHVITWIISVGFAFVGYFFQWGMFAGLDILWTAIYGVACGLVVDGLFGVSTLESVLTALKSVLPPKKN